MAERCQINRIVFSSFGLGFCVFLAISLFSFSIYDWPNPDVVTTESNQNLCGPVGAYLAYRCNYYLGLGTIPLLLAHRRRI